MNLSSLSNGKTTERTKNTKIDRHENSVLFVSFMVDCPDAQAVCRSQRNAQVHMNRGGGGRQYEAADRPPT